MSIDLFPSHIYPVPFPAISPFLLFPDSSPFLLFSTYQNRQISPSRKKLKFSGSPFCRVILLFFNLANPSQARCNLLSMGPSPHNWCCSTLAGRNKRALRSVFGPCVFSEQILVAYANGQMVYYGFVAIQNEPPQDVPHWYLDYFGLKATKALQTEEKLLPHPLP